MNNIINLYNFFYLKIKALFISDSVTLSIIYERLIIFLLVLFTLLSLIFQGFINFIIFQKLFILVIGLHSYQGLNVIFDDYVKNIFVNNLFKSFILILWFTLLFS